MMVRLSTLFFSMLVVVIFCSVSSDLVLFLVTFVECVQNSTCPEGNPTRFNATFALNGTLSPNVSLNVGDQLQFNLLTNVTIHPLTICENSTVPQFCQDADNSDILNTPITEAGTNISVTFNTTGTYSYGCYNHPGMGGMIMVTQRSNSAEHHLSELLLFITIIPLLKIIFI